MFKTIQSRILSILVGFIVLLAAGAGASYVILQRQADDGLLVNLAGRQRMLTQKMAKESVQLANVATTGMPAQTKAEAEKLAQTMRVFEMTLIALKDGGAAPLNLDVTRVRQTPPASTPEIRARLEEVASLWTPFKKNANEIINSSGTSAGSVSAIVTSNMELLEAMNKAVDLMQSDQEAKVKSLYLVQSIALGCGLLLVVIGAWFSGATITNPIVELSEAARLMSTGNLNVEFRPKGASEVRELGASFDRMRASMVAAFGASAGAKTLADDDV
jgi:nitrate/nitrite-specific signal transduction histidine kinase